MGVLFAPLIQVSFSVFKLEPLKGSVTYPDQVPFHAADWFTSKYQEAIEVYLNEMFGFRSMCVRINNQIAYSFFNQANANGVIIGKENYLYEESYLNSYNGKDFVGEDSLNHTIERIESIHSCLKALNKKLIIVLAPSKAAFFPEYIPDKFLPIKKATNYKYFAEKLNNSKLDVIDFNKWFIENKKKSKYPLYPKLGIHWSVYASVLAADSILKFIGNKLERPISKITIEDIVLADPKDTDLDIADGANLLFNISSHKMAYPIIKLDCLADTNKPSLVVVGDSYYWSINVLGIANCFKKESFWYYNTQVYSKANKSNLVVHDLNIEEEIVSNDVFIILVTEPNIQKIGWGFIESLQTAFKGKSIANLKSVVSQRKIKDWKEYIKKNSTWLENAKKTAKQKHISVDSVVTLDAIWQIQQEK